MRLIAVDIGNSAAAAVRFDGEAIGARRESATPRRDRPGFGRRLLQGLAQAGDAVVISSVVPFLDETVRREVVALTGREPLFLDHRLPLGLHYEVDDPAEIGADRLADCLGALARWPAPLIVIDSGTATTFELLAPPATYIGGCILPGVGISLRALAQNTAKLGEVEFVDPPVSPVGKNTVEHIVSGVFFGHVGAIRELTARYRDVLGREARVVVTGGLSAFLAGQMPEIDEYEPDLIFLGLRELWRKCRDRHE